MLKKYCCENCFGDPALTRSIIPLLIGKSSTGRRQGDCGYCGNVDVITIDPSSLSQWFEMLIDCYKPDPKGKSLATLLAEDWCLFDHPAMDEAHAKELLAEILNDGEIVRTPKVIQGLV
jgi:hypothetical protein